MAKHFYSVCVERRDEMAQWADHGTAKKELDSATVVLDAMQRTLRELGSLGQAARLEALSKAAANSRTLEPRAKAALKTFIAKLLEDISTAGGLTLSEAGHTAQLKHGVDTVMPEGGKGTEVLSHAASHRTFDEFAADVHNFVAEALLVVPHGQLHLLASTHLHDGESSYLQMTHHRRPSNTPTS